MSGPSVARLAAYRTLCAVEERSAYAHLALHAELGRVRLAARDVALTSDIVRGTLTWRSLLDHYIERLSVRGTSRLESSVRVILRLSLYQLRFLDRVPPYAAISDAVELAKAFAPRASGFVNGLLRSAVREPEYPMPLTDERAAAGMSRSEFALRASYPEWLVATVIDALGEATGQAALVAMNARPVRCARTNTLRSSRDNLVERLGQEGASAAPSPICAQGVRLGTGVNVVALRAYKEGLCTLQGESSMRIAPLLQPEPGQRLLDACAAPGGKTTHLAELAGDRADIQAYDVHPRRAAQVSAQAQRLGLRSVRVTAGDCRQDGGYYDGVLLDAPCTGIGTIARKPDLKWRLKQDDIAALASVQSQLLDAVADRVSPGGRLVYSVCTLTPEEGRQQAEKFLARRAEYSFESIAAHAGPVQIWPQESGGDGFFAAVFVRSRGNL